ncbi:sel1 repeat family protein [Methylophilaceae bacterium]|nr:sel1 repeat family protein [Methylophilaceae bacterium]
MKKLLLITLFSSQIVWAKDTKDLLTKLPPLVIEMIQEYPHTFYATLSCFNYPKINVNACEQIANVDHPGSAYPKHNLGYANEFGDAGLKKNYSDAFYWYLRASNQGLISSQYNLARIYEYGLGVEISHVMAKQLYEKAANQGDKKAEERFEILMLLAINQAVEKGQFPYQEKLNYMTRLEPWQIKEANNYFN